MLGDNLVPRLHFSDSEPEALEGDGTPQVVGERQVQDDGPGLLPAHWKWFPLHHAAGDTLVLPAPGSRRTVPWQAGPGLERRHGRRSLRLGLLTQALAEAAHALEEGSSEGPLAFPLLFSPWLSSFYPTPQPFSPLIPAPAPIPTQSLWDLVRDHPQLPASLCFSGGCGTPRVLGLGPGPIVPSSLPSPTEGLHLNPWGIRNPVLDGEWGTTGEAMGPAFRLHQGSTPRLCILQAGRAGGGGKGAEKVGLDPLGAQANPHKEGGT